MGLARALAALVMALAASSAAAASADAAPNRQLKFATQCTARLRTCNSNLSAAKKKVARMAPAANRLASCNKNTARLAAQLSARTNALSRCNSDASGLNKQLSKTRRRMLTAATNDDATLAVDLSVTQSERITRLEAALAAANAEIEWLAESLRESQGELYSMRDQDLVTQDTLSDCMQESIDAQTGLDSCTIMLEGAQSRVSSYRAQLNSTTTLEQMCQDEVEATKSLLAKAEEEARSASMDADMGKSDLEACDSTLAACRAAQEGADDKLAAVTKHAGNCTQSLVTLGNQMVTLSTANKTNAELAAERGRQLDDCPAGERGTVHCQVKRLAPGAKQLAGCIKGSSGLAAKLGAKTRALRRCTTSAADLNKQLRTLKLRATKTAALAPKAAGVNAALLDVAEDCPTALADAQAQNVELQRQLAAMQAELTAALADSSSLAAELEGAYVMLGEAQGEIYALRDQGVSANDALHDCLMDNIGLNAQLYNATQQLETSRFAETVCQSNFNDSEAAFEQCWTLSTCQTTEDASASQLSACQDDLAAAAAQRDTCRDSLQACDAVGEVTAGQLADLRGQLSECTDASVTASHRLIECRQASDDCAASLQESERHLSLVEDSYRTALAQLKDSTKLAASDKRAATLAARLAAKTAALRKCGTQSAALSKQLSVARRSRPAAAVTPRALSFAAAVNADDGGTGAPAPPSRPGSNTTTAAAATELAAALQQVAQLEAMLATARAQLNATLAELEATYSDLAAAVAETYAATETEPSVIVVKAARQGGGSCDLAHAARIPSRRAGSHRGVRGGGKAMAAEGGASLQRVKVYKLNEEGLWDDKGTGRVTVEVIQDASGSVGLVVMGEGANMSPLLLHRISRENTYQRQGDDTIITWTDPEIGTDIALSFQEARGCNYIWEQVLHVQESSSPRAGGGGDMADAPYGPRRFGGGGPNEGDYDVAGPGGPAGRYDEMGPMADPGSSGAVELPDPELSNLKDIARALTEVSLFQRDRIAQQLATRRGYLARLLELFRMSEDLEDEESLAALFNIFKQIVLLNDTALFDLLFDEAHVMDFVGALEYEPDIKPEQRARHREFLRDQAVFKEVVPITDPALKSKIHQTYRMGYLKDVVLPRVLDDATFATLSSLMLFNNIEVLMALYQDREFFPDLFRRLKAAQPGGQEWRDLVAFLQELCGLTKHLQAQQRNSLLLRLVGLGLFQVITTIMQQPGSAEVKLRATDILLADVQHDPAQLRSYLLSPGEGAVLFSLLIRALLDSSDSGLQEQVLEMLKMLLDPDTLDQSAEKDKFVELFYEKGIAELLTALVQASESPYGEGAPSANTVGLVVDLLCFCVVSHSYRIKYYILKNNVVEKVLKLLRRKERWLAVAAVRFLRTALSMKDEFYNRYLVKNQLLKPVVAAFLDNGPRYNLLNSACLELFDFIRRENFKGLLSELMEHHWTQLREVDYCDVFKAMHLKHEQNQDRVGPGKPAEGETPAAAAAREADLLARQRAAAAAEQRRRRGEREVDADEENYFDREGDSDDDEQPAGAGGGRVVLESASPGGLPSLLMAYADDEEEEEDTLPLRAAGTPKRYPAGQRPGSPPLEKRFRSTGSSPGGSGAWPTGTGGRSSPPLR
ncbi:Serine threonine-phosphatase 4 regulatory subunit 3 isoform B [Micractinium conductrix]|uniref:Serine threonine-phosphatase 4 regulatory subunit 3 isoform B n=1 Tax=Micractinium conductrix TaxID=554055 RepID=A0A2P6VJE2_9CHLO|nr:Serine threonine-phosphatase 4 regulatory subunit 3 isoform B [Micractinium conductrix]|eukprot:PSC74221.1 Serine threonine-phosphatase 4 regulatory subunit 3 isoform B [Micractinium conductrix]